MYVCLCLVPRVINSGHYTHSAFVHLKPAVVVNQWLVVDWWITFSLSVLVNNG